MKGKAMIVPIILVILMWLVFFLPAGSLSFWQAWFVWGGFSVLTVGMVSYFAIKAPQFLERRATVQKKDDANKSPVIFKLFYLGFLLPGFDYRFQWSKEPVWLVVIAMFLTLFGYFFIILVFRENTYAAAVIQVEQDQQVIETGPYRWIRHPMYTGMLVMSLFMPLALGSYIAFVPMLFIIPMLVLRIKKEEQLLRQKLNGYEGYCERVRYRMIPFVW